MSERAISKQALPNLERKSRKKFEFGTNTSGVNGFWVSLKGTRAYPWIIPGSSLLWCSSGGYRFQFQSICVLTPAARALCLRSITSPAIRSPLQIDRAKCSNSAENRSHKMGCSLCLFLTTPCQAPLSTLCQKGRQLKTRIQFQFCNENSPCRMLSIFYFS